MPAHKTTEGNAERAYDDYVQKNHDAACAARRDRARQMRQHFPQSTAMRDYRPEVAGMATEAIPNRIDGLTTDRETRSTIDQYAEAGLGNRKYFLNRPHGIGWTGKDRVP
jgi:hypothetical protein